MLIFGTCMYQTDQAMVIYLYERSKCRYIRLNALKVLHVHGPCFNAPLLCGCRFVVFHALAFVSLQIDNFLITNSFANIKYEPGLFVFSAR